MRRTLSVLVAVLVAAGVVAGTGAAAQAASPLNPVGNLDRIVYDGRLTVSGWTFDPETAAPIDVHAYVDGRIVAVARADRSRPDVAAVYPSYGPSHGWSLDLGKQTAGTHQVCVYAINVGIGDTNPALGCRTFTVAGNAALNPVGNLEEVVLLPQGLYLEGWTFDPETPAPIDVHVYIDGRIAAVLPAADPRPDVAAVYPSYGERHGFTAVVTPPLPGRHQVCVYAINVGEGTTNPALGCRTFTVSLFNFGATATYENGVGVAVALPRRVAVSDTSSPSLPPGFTGVLFEITLRNGSSEVFEPFEDVFLSSGPGGLEAPLTFDSGGSNPRNGFSGSIPPGASETASFLFQVPNGDLDQLRLEVSPDFVDYEPVFFGGVA